MLVLAYHTPPHAFRDASGKQDRLICPCCKGVYIAEDCVIVEAVASPTYNDPCVDHTVKPLCSLRCVLHFLGGGSRA